MAFVKGKNPSGEHIDFQDGVTDGADVIVGNAGKDTIDAGGGNDVIKGGGGADYIEGGAGRDTATYEDSTVGIEVSLVTGKGKGGTAEGDTLSNVEDLFGSSFDDKLIGNSGDNTLNGSGGNDTLKGGGGSDTLLGGTGNDIVEMDAIGDKADGGEGVDTLILKSEKGLEINLATGFIQDNKNGYGINYWQNSPYWDGVGHQMPSMPHYYGEPQQAVNFENVIGTAYDDDIYGNELANNLSGGNGNDVLAGGGGNDILAGGNGKDIIDGGNGADTLTGGLDQDKFWFSALDDSVVVGGMPQDVITDFQQGVDQIDLSHVSFALGDLLVLDNQNAGGTNYSFVGVDANHNGVFDEGEFAIAVKMANGAVLNSGDLIL